MTHDERVARLRGQYPPRHAEFLALVTAHGGYFLRRHVTRFLGGRDGGKTTAFLHYLQHRHVVRIFVGRRGTRLYHVYRKRLYALLEEADNRNRRVVAPARVVRKLMALDLVLTDPHVRWLETEDEKVEYFTQTACLPRSALPGTWHPTRADLYTGTVRYFVDKAPISVGADGLVTLAYIQGVEYGLSGFRAFLRRHARLCAGLRHVQIAWVAPRLSRVRRARAAMQTWARRSEAVSRIGGHLVHRALTAYCDTRRQLTGYSIHPELWVKERRLVRDLQQRVIGPRFPEIFTDWCTRGAAAIDELVAQERPLDLSHVRFRAVCLPGRYDIFGTAFGVAPSGRHAPDPPRPDLVDLAA